MLWKLKPELLADSFAVSWLTRPCSFIWQSDANLKVYGSTLAAAHLDKVFKPSPKTKPATPLPFF